MTRTVKIQRADPRRKIFIVKDHGPFHKNLAQIINGQKDLSVCGEAGGAERAAAAIVSLKADLALVVVELSGQGGAALVRELRSQSARIKILVVSNRGEARYANGILRAGADGYVLKLDNLEEVVHAIRDVLAGHIYVSEEVLAGTVKTSLRRTSKPGTVLIRDRKRAA
jgi:DNA-binding NarL/FixJ family response regulator